MALVRILVDGYSFLHNCPEIAPGKPRHSASAREELVAFLTRYRDAVGTPITVVFDGMNAPAGVPKHESSAEMEVIYSKHNKTADDVIERVTHRLLPYGHVLVVTEDYAERDTVISLGGDVASCQNFMSEASARLNELDRDLREINQRERRAFNRR